MTAGPLRGHYHSPSSAGSASSNSAAARLILTPDSSGSGVDSDSDDDGGRPGDISLNDGGEVGSGFRFGFEGEDEGETYELQDRRSSTPWDLEQDEEEEEDEDGHESEGSRSRRSRRRRRRRRRRSDDGSVASFQLYTPDEERAVVRKFDRRLVLFLSLCYMLSFLDRSNIGNARIAGMEEDLQTRPRNEALYGWALTAFYLAYIAFEWMSLLWRLVPAHVYVSLVVLSWGLAASLQAVATSYPILIGLRALLGVGEAAFTGVPFYLSFFFRRRELAFRTAMFISAAPLATSFASTLAWLILKLGQNGPIAPWRLLFLLEGFPSVIIATVAWNVIPDSPGTAYYLSAREKKVARLRLRHENPSHSSSSESQRQQRHQRRGSASPSRLGARAVLSALVDAKAWITSLIFFLTNMAYSSLPVFLPQILTEMGHSPLESQALTAPPYLVSFLAVLLTAHLSDRLGSRSPFVVLHALASAAGYAVLAAGRAPMLRYAAVYPAAVGFFNVVVLVVSWSVNNQPDEGRRGGGFALLQVVGQCGPLLGTRLYPDSDKPFYERGMWVCAGAMLGVAVLAVALRAYLGWLNRRLGWKGEDKGLREGEDEDGNVDMDVEEAIGLVGNAAGDRDEGRDGERRVPAFRYML